MAHLVKRDQRLVIAGPARRRVGPSNRNICMRGLEPSAGVDMLALSVPLKSFPSARIGSPSDAAEPEVVLLRVAGCLVEAGFVPAVVQPVHVEEHPDEAVLQVVGVGRRTWRDCIVVEHARRGDLAVDVAVPNPSGAFRSA